MEKIIVEYSGGAWFGIFAGAISVLVVGGLTVLGFQMRNLYNKVDRLHRLIWELQQRDNN